MQEWLKIELQLVAQGTCRTSRLELTTSKRGVIWFDQVSLMPSGTYKVFCIYFLSFVFYLSTDNHKVMIRSRKQLIKFNKYITSIIKNIDVRLAFFN